MQRKIWIIINFLVTSNLLFSQSIKSNIDLQIDKVLTTISGKAEFVSSINLGNEVYILCRTKDSLSVTSYTVTANDKVYNVYSISVSDDTSFTNTIDRLFHSVRQSYRYQPYSKRILTGAKFLLTFKENNKLKMFYKEIATQGEIEDIKLIVESMDIYTIMPYGKPNPRIKVLKIEDWNGLLRYFDNIGHGSKYILK